MGAAEGISLWPVVHTIWMHDMYYMLATVHLYIFSRLGLRVIALRHMPEEWREHLQLNRTAHSGHHVQLI